MKSRGEARASKQWYQGRGLKRREALITALRELLESHEISEIRYQAVADRAGIPLPSCYNLFTNKADLLQGLAEYYSPIYTEQVFAPLAPDATPGNWTELVDTMTDRSIAFIDNNIAARRIWFSFDVPANVTVSTRERERQIALAYRRFFSRYFKLPDNDNTDEYFFLALEIADRIINVAENSDPVMRGFFIKEAKRAQKAYLGVHIPQLLPKARPGSAQAE